MAELAKSGKIIRDFPGLDMETDLHELKEGSTDVQVNCTSEDVGVLRSRHGYVVLTFEGE